MSSSTQKQQQRRHINTNNNNNSQQSRNTNAYFDRQDYHQRSLINNNKYWNQDYHRSNTDFYMDDYYQGRNTSQRIRQKQESNSKSTYSLSLNNNQSYYDNIPPRRRIQQQIHSSRLQDTRIIHKPEDIKISNPTMTNDGQQIKPLQSASSSSTNSDVSNHAGTTNRKDLHAKNLAAAAIAARQQNPQPQTNIGVVQALMNSLILQQQQSSPQAQSTVQLQHQLTNALLATMIQQRLKEAALQAQAQQIQAALPSLLAAQALVYQQQGQLAATQQQAQSLVPSNVAHPGTKFNNRPLVKFPVVRPTMMMPVIRPSVTTNQSRHRLGTNNTQQILSTTTLPTYQQVQEIERGISLDEAIHLKSAIDIADRTNESESIPSSEKNY